MASLGLVLGRLTAGPGLVLGFPTVSLGLGRRLAGPGLVLGHPTTGSVCRLPRPCRCIACCGYSCAQLGLIHGGDLVALRGLPGAAALLVEARSPGKGCPPGGMGGVRFGRGKS